MKRRSTLRGLSALLALAPVLGRTQSTPGYPGGRPIRIVVPFPPGGSDAIARAVAQQLTQSLGTSVVVENRPGGGAMIGSAHVAKSVPDGHTVLMTVGSPLIVNPVVYRRMPYDALKDFTPVTQVTTLPFGMAVLKTHSANNLAEFIAHARKQAQPLSYGSTGLGSANHILGEAVNRRTGLQMVHVPYQGSAPAVNDLLGGHVAAIYADVGTLAAQVDAGRVKVLGLTGSQRLRPDLPTFEEQGLPNLRSSWIGAFLPAGAPTAVVELLAAHIAQALKAREVVELVRKSGQEAVGSTPQAMGEALRSSLAYWAALVKEIGGVSLD